MQLELDPIGNGAFERSAYRAAEGKEITFEFADLVGAQLIGKLEGRNLSGPGEPYVREYLAMAYAATGNMVAARAELARAAAAAKREGMTRQNGDPDLNGRIVAAVMARAGDYDAAIRELRILIEEDAWTRAGIAREPKLLALRGNPKYEAFLKERE